MHHSVGGRRRRRRRGRLARTRCEGFYLEMAIAVTVTVRSTASVPGSMTPNDAMIGS
jgi:hypothetical protein